MKLLLFTSLILSLYCNSANAQNGSLPETGSVYTYVFLDVFSPEDQRFLFIWGNDTNINDTVYRKFYREGAFGDTLFVREESNKWFLRNIPTIVGSESSELLIYDWSIVEGDTVSSISVSTFENPHLLLVDSIESVLTLDGITRKQYFLSSLTLPDVIDPPVWLEGVAGLDSSSGYKIICAEINGELVYESDYSEFLIDYEACNWSTTNIQDSLESPELIIHPNPASGIVNIKGRGANDPFIIFNSFGKKIEKIEKVGEFSYDVFSLETGIYFLHFTKGDLIRKLIII